MLFGFLYMMVAKNQLAHVLYGVIPEVIIMVKNSSQHIG